MASTLSGKTIAFLVAPEGIEQVELTEPWKAVEGAGGTPRLVSTDTGKVQAFNHLDKADTFDVDDTVDGMSAADYDGLVLPGGVAPLIERLYHAFDAAGVWEALRTGRLPDGWQWPHRVRLGVKAGLARFNGLWRL